ncbi:MAG TPA: hypothetical protein VLG68_02125 [Gammaproteobacteria bacterium]|nr:hypothetical protein [Gammaproteobacteria bacterium]
MNRKSAKGLLAALIFLSSNGLMAVDAQAGTASGQLSVGIVILDACHVAVPQTVSAYRLTAAAGFGLKCAKGTDYSVQVSGDARRNLSAGSSGVTTVTVRF